MRVLNLADRAKAYGIPSEIVDGNDVLAVYRSSRRAVERAREGGGPTLIEAKTFRMRGHAAHDNQSYVPKELLDQWRARDPIAYFEKYLLENNVAAASEIEEVTSRVDAELDADLAWAESQPAPEGESALGDVFASAQPTVIGAGK
jgi:TPP-dependent pyruvate/acetoin dehydrogenase alpha subunit